MTSHWNPATSSKSGFWSVAANWSGGVPNAIDAIASFDGLGANAADWSIDLGNSAWTVGTLDLWSSSLQAYDLINGVLHMQATGPRGSHATIDDTALGAGNDDTLASSLTLALNSTTQTVVNTGGTLDIEAQVTGAGALEVSGAGTTILGNGLNGWTGGLYLLGGVLKTTADFVLADSVTNIAAGATLDLDGTKNVVWDLSGGGAITNTGHGAATLTLFNDIASTFSGAIIEQNAIQIGLYKDGAGVLTLTGPLNISGPVLVHAGTLTLGPASGLPGEYSDYVTVDAGATLDNNVAGLPLGELLGAGTVILEGSSQLLLELGVLNDTFDGAITGAGNISLGPRGSFPGTGVIELSGKNTFSGYTDVGQGGLRGNAKDALSPNSHVDMSGGAIDLGGFDQVIGGLSGSGTVTTTGGAYNSFVTLTVNENQLSNFSGQIVDGANNQHVRLTKSGSGSLILSGVNTYSGDTYVTAGFLTVGAAGTLSANSVMTVDPGAVLDLNGFDATVKGLWGGGAVRTQAGVDVTLTTTGIGSFGGTIADGAAHVGLTVAGAPGYTSETLSGVNTYSGLTRINSGYLAAAADNAFSANSDVVVGTGAEITMNGHSETIGALSGSGVVSGSGAFGLTSNPASLTEVNSTASAFYGQMIDGSCALSFAKSGAGTLTLYGANTYSGSTQINAGSLKLGAGGSLGQNTAMTIASGASFDLDGVNQTIASLSGAGSVIDSAAGASILTVDDNLNTTFSGAINQTAGVLSLMKSGAAALSLSGASQFSGGVDLRAGALDIANVNAVGSGAIHFHGAATLRIQTGDAPANAITGFSPGDVIDLIGLTSHYSPNLTGVAAPSSFTLAIAGNVVTQTNSDGSKLSSHFNIGGSQSYTTVVRSFDASGDLTAVEHEGITGTPYIADTTLYSGPGTTGNIVSGNDLFYANQASGLAEVDLDGGGNLNRALYAYATTAPGTQTGFEADYVAGQLAGGVATYLALAGAPYATFTVEYDNNYQYVGAAYTFNYTGQTYDEAQYSYTAAAQPKLTEATFSQYTGSGGPNVASFFYDNNGASTGVQYSYVGITGQNYTSDTLLYNSANVLIAAQYNSYANKPFSSQTTFYNASGVAQEIVRDFTNPALAGVINGQAYNAFERIFNPAFTLLATAYHLDNGGNVYIGVASNVSSPTFGGTGVSDNTAEISNTLTGGDWTITGGGTGETFNLAAFFNQAEITDYGAAFSAATDVISVSTQDFADWTTMLADAAPSGAGANTTFTSTTTGDKLTLDGVTVAQLTALTGNQAAAHFTFHA